MRIGSLFLTLHSQRFYSLSSTQVSRLATQPLSSRLN